MTVAMNSTTSTIKMARVAPGLTDLTIAGAAFSSSWSAASVGGVNVVDWLLLASAVLTLLARIGHRRPVYISFWMIAPFFAAIVVETMAVFTGRSDAFAAVMVLRVLLATTVVAVLIESMAIANVEKALIQLLGWWAMGITLSSATALLVASGLISLEGVLIQATGERLSGLAAHPNGLAFSITMVFPVVLYLLRSVTVKIKVMWFTALLINLCALFLSDSRSGLLVGAVSLGLSVLLAIRSTRGRVWVAPVLLLAGSLAVVKLPTLLAGTRLFTGAPLSDAARSTFNARAFQEFLSNPILGGGFGALGGVAVPLQLVSTGGVVLLLAYYIYVFRPMASFWRRRQEHIASTGFLTLVMLVAFGFSNPVILERAAFWPALIVYFYLQSAEAALPAREPWKK
jgi:hypothetical protein